MHKKFFRFVSSAFLIFVIGHAIMQANALVCLAPEVFGLFDALRFSALVLLSFVLGLLWQAEVRISLAGKSKDRLDRQDYSELWLSKHANRPREIEANL